MTCGSLFPLLQVGRLLAISILAAYLLGALWVVLGWMRFFGLETGVVAQALPIVSPSYHNLFLDITAQGIDWYNSVFQGNARFGSGLGLIAGATAGIIMFGKQSNSIARHAVMFAAGAIIGGRTSLTFTSEPVSFLLFSTLSGAGFVLIAGITRETLPSLPLRPGNSIRL